MSDNEGWLIERGQPEGQSPIVWWCANGEWTTDSAKACRFATHEEATSKITEKSAVVGDRFGRATEHSWHPAAPETVLDVPGALHAHDVEHVTTRNSEGEEVPASPRFPFIPAWYALYFVAMCKTARECGYALALHGSLQRDLDVLAVPWTEAAISADALVAKIAEKHGLMRGHDGRATIKPHGRLAYTLMMGGHFYINLSVMDAETPTATQRADAAEVQVAVLRALINGSEHDGNERAPCNWIVQGGECDCTLPKRVAALTTTASKPADGLLVSSEQVVEAMLIAYGAPAEHHDALRGRMRNLARGTRHCIDEADQRAQAVARALGVTKENA